MITYLNVTRDMSGSAVLRQAGMRTIAGIVAHCVVMQGLTRLLENV